MTSGWAGGLKTGGANLIQFGALKAGGSHYTGTDAGPRRLTVLLSCGGGDGGGDSTVLRMNVVSYIIFLYVCICDHIPSTNITICYIWMYQ